MSFGSGGRTRTGDLRVMGPTSCQTALPRVVVIAVRRFVPLRQVQGHSTQLTALTPLSSSLNLTMFGPSDSLFFLNCACAVMCFRTGRSHFTQLTALTPLPRTLTLRLVILAQSQDVLGLF